MWFEMTLTLLGHALEKTYGPVMGLGLFLFSVGWKGRSPKVCCVGGLLVVLAIRQGVVH